MFFPRDDTLWSRNMLPKSHPDLGDISIETYHMHAVKRQQFGPGPDRMGQQEDCGDSDDLCYEC